MENTTVRIRPLRLAFLSKPSDKAALQQVFEINSGMWGGLYNFIIPYIKTLPTVYREPYMKRQRSAVSLMKGMIEGIQPDFLVEMEVGMAAGLGFPAYRTITVQQLTGRDEDNRAAVGVDMRSICQDLWDSEFQFVQKKPRTVVLPHSKDPKYDLMFSCLFGSYGNKGGPGDFSRHYQEALGGAHQEFEPEEFPSLFDVEYLFPLRLTTHELKREARRRWAEPRLFFFNENNAYDLIDLWNMRAIGWQVGALPISLAPKLEKYCVAFVRDEFRRKNNTTVMEHARIVCARSQEYDTQHAYLATLGLNEHDRVLTDHVPNLWEESSRISQDAEPYLITNATKTVSSRTIGNGFHVDSALPDFLEDDYTASTMTAVANILDTVADGATVIPWQQNLSSLVHDFKEDKTFVSRDGIVFTAGDYSTSRYIRVPTSLNVFTALADGVGYKLNLSPAGQTAYQIIKALGGHLSLSSIVLKSAQFLKYLNNLAHEDVEVDLTNDEEKKRLKKPYAPYKDVVRELQSLQGPAYLTVERQLSNLVSYNVLRPGLTLQCPECHHTSWYAIGDIQKTFTCPRCSHVFPFPTGSPPDKGDWGYKISGPFAADRFAHGAYCVIATMNLLSRDARHKSTWIPSFEMVNKDDKKKKLEADFSMFIEPTYSMKSSAPAFVIGECKSFNTFEDRDFERARQAMELFPGVALCFATFRDNLKPSEKRRFRAIANAGREILTPGHQRNPVIIFTGKELFGQYKMGDFYGEYGQDECWIRRHFEDGDLQALGEFTQVQYLDMKPTHEVRQAKRVKMAEKKSRKRAGKK